MSKFIKIVDLLINRDNIASVTRGTHPETGNDFVNIFQMSTSEQVFVVTKHGVFVQLDMGLRSFQIVSLHIDMDNFTDWLYRVLEDDPHVASEFPPKQTKGYMVSGTNPPNVTPLY